MLANSLVELDRAHLIHPVASWRGHEAAGVRLLTSAKGATVTDAEGRFVFGAGVAAVRSADLAV